ncbi:MAG: hypothetical protein RML72_01450 [Bacteroidia bacterium]|nr:hypothetical protein [Bacteroidia bacterium]MDW8157524.1 hypothetical protein [Bacteroidia bacterium]
MVQQIFGFATMTSFTEQLQQWYQQQGLRIGLQKGLQKGRKQGLQKGLQKGLEKGLQKGLQKGIINMLKAGKYTEEEIAQTFEVTLQYVQKIKEKIQNNNSPS